jgi:serine/threonine-protein kinase HipA
MRRFFVWVRRANGLVSLAGELATTEPSSSGHFESEFEYTQAWLEDPTAFSLDPASLPRDVRSRRFRATLFHPPLAIFDDALPDDWGRRLLTAAIRLERRKPSPPEMLLHMRSSGTGALAFTESPQPPELVPSAQSKSLPTLLSAAERFEAGTLPPDDDFRKLLEGSSRAGGARPKALVHDDQGEWIAKFPSRTRDDAYDVVGLEATCLELARHAGLNVPESRLQPVGRRRVLLVRRFDVSAQNGRVHMVSMKTLCKERPGIYVTSYTQLAEALQKYSSSPAEDISMLFRHMAFNAAVGNVDDHLKNFWMIAAATGYRLAPAFDLVPDIAGRSEHTLMFQYSFACPKRDDLLEIARAWGVSAASDIVSQVIRAVERFGTTARKQGVRGGASLENVQTDIRRRLRILR